MTRIEKGSIMNPYRRTDVSILMVIAFSNSEYSGYSEGLRGMLTTALVLSKRYRVLERRNVDSIEDEIALQEDGKYVAVNTPQVHMRY